MHQGSGCARSGGWPQGEPSSSPSWPSCCFAFGEAAPTARNDLQSCATLRPRRSAICLRRLRTSDANQCKGELLFERWLLVAIPLHGARAAKQGHVRGRAKSEQSRLMPDLIGPNGRLCRLPTLSSSRACRPLLEARSGPALGLANCQQEERKQGTCHDDKHDDHCRVTGVIEEISSSIVHVLSFLLLCYNAPGRSGSCNGKAYYPNVLWLPRSSPGESRTCGAAEWAERQSRPNKI